MKKAKLLLLSIALGTLLLSFVGCKKKENGKVTVTTKAVTEITANNAKSGGKVTLTGNAEIGVCGVCWSESPSPTTNDFFTTDIVGAGEYISTMNSLKPNTKYYVRAYATPDSGEVMYGEEKTFTTLPDDGGGNGGGNSGGEGTITVTTNDVSEITPSSATCGGNVTVTGEVTITARGICYGTSHNPTIENTHTSEGQGSGSFTSNLTGLSANTKYYLKAYAQSGSDITYGEEKSFTTTANPQLPTVTVGVINVSPAYLELKFEPSSNTAYYCYNIGGTLTSTTHYTGVKTQKYSSYRINSTLYYIQPDTEYEFTVVAYDANGTAGEVIHPKFRTNPAPYSNYYRVNDSFYQLSYAKLRNQPSGNANSRFKEIILWSNPGYWVHFETLVYSYETDNIWYPGVYTTTNNGVVGIGQYICNVYKNGSAVGVGGGSTFTISKSGSTYTYDLYGDNGSITAHFTGVPTY